MDVQQALTDLKTVAANEADIKTAATGALSDLLAKAKAALAEGEQAAGEFLDGAKTDVENIWAAIVKGTSLDHMA